MLDHARTYASRLSVLTAPVFGDDDPLYRGTRLPRRFWKIVAWNDGDASAPELAATGFGLAPLLGAYLTYQVPVVDIATLTGLGLGPLVTADRMAPPAAALPVDLAGGSLVLETRWPRLQHVRDVVL